MMRANRSTLAKLCLLTALAVPVQRAASAAEATRATESVFAGTSKLVAQAPTETLAFAPPTSLASDSALRIDGSSSMQNLNDALIGQFVERYPDVAIDSGTDGTDIALERWQNGEIDLAAMGRPLSEAEEGAGLVSVPVAVEKIAIFVSPENGFDDDLMFNQFVRIFRGEITDWSEVGGDPGPIRFVDRPASSETRAAFSRYDAFKAAGPFASGATADPVSVDDTQAVIDRLGSDGIGYAIANQVLGNDAVKIVPMHKTLPDNPAYPFSQPRGYVYASDRTPAVEGFLAVATGAEGQAAVEEVQATEGAAVAQLEGAAPTATSPDGSLSARTNENNVAIIEDANGEIVAGPLAAAGGAVTALAFSPDGQTLATGTNTGKVRYWNVADGTPQSEAFAAGDGTAITGLEFEANDKLSVANEGRRGLWGLNGEVFGEDLPATNVVATTSNSDGSNADEGVPWWLWLIPLLGLLGAGFWLLFGRNRETAAPEPRRQTAPTATVPPPATDPDSEREVSNRAQTVIKTDRVTDESRAVVPPVASSDASFPNVPVTAQAQPGVDDPDLLEFESTDLEEPQEEDSNLDLRTAGLVSGAALGGVAIAGTSFSGVGFGDDIEIDDDDDDDEWDDNLDFTLYDPDIPTIDIISTAGVGGIGADEMIASESISGGSAASSLDDIEPTRDTVIAETNDVPDIEPDRTTIIGDSAVIFGGAAAGIASAAAATPNQEIRSETPGVEDVSADIDSFFSAGDDLAGDSAEIVPASREETLEAGLSPVLEDPVLEDPAIEDPVIEDLTPDLSASEPVLDPAVVLGSAAAGIAGGIVNSIRLKQQGDLQQSTSAEVDAEAGAEAGTQPPRSYTVEELALVDEDLLELPEGYSDSRIVLLPRDPKWAYAYWDISNEHKEELRRQGGQRLALRLYDVTDLDQNYQTPHSMQQQDCDEIARSWYLEIPVSDRDYAVEIGYLTGNGQWLMLSRSAPIRVPPIYPADWVNDQFVTVTFDEDLAGRTFGELGSQPNPTDGDTAVEGLPPLYDELFAMTQGQNALRVAGSLFGSMHQLAPDALSPSGNLSGLNVSGLNLSGLNMPGAGISGKRNFWLVADAELIVYGATEPDATLTVGDRVIPLGPDGTFRFHAPFPDGKMEYPIRAVAVDGGQSRSIAMNFERETPERNTNTKEDAPDEWF